MGIFDRRRRKESPPDSIEDAMASQAADFVHAFAGPGSPVPAGALDYTRASLGAVDAVLQDFYAQGAELPEKLHWLTTAYLYEVARREFGGRYLHGDDDNPLVLVVGGPDAQVGVLGFGKVRGRVVNGPEDDLGFFYDGIAPALAQGRSTTLV